MEECEKGFVKKKYDMIGKEKKDGIVVEDDLEEDYENQRRV